MNQCFNLEINRNTAHHFHRNHARHKVANNENHRPLYGHHLNTVQCPTVWYCQSSQGHCTYFGGTIGGPIKIPWLARTDRKKTDGSFTYEQFIRRRRRHSAHGSIPRSENAPETLPIRRFCRQSDSTMILLRHVAIPALESPFGTSPCGGLGGPQCHLRIRPTDAKLACKAVVPVFPRQPTINRSTTTPSPSPSPAAEAAT